VTIRIILFASFLVMALGVESMAVDLKSTPVRLQMARAVTETLAAAPVPAHAGLGATAAAARPARKSMWRAAAYSALLPGLGEYYVGNRRKARYFFAAETVSWVGFFAFRTYGSWKKDDYIDFAREKAGAQLEGKSDEFNDWVGFYNDIDQFNTLGRVADRDRPYLEDTPENHWRWQSLEDRMAYRNLKNRSREAYRRADFMIGVMVLSRIISIIDAVHDARVAGSIFEQASADRSGRRLAYDIDVDPIAGEWQIDVAVVQKF
jgi:hypothetical protein